MFKFDINRTTGFPHLNLKSNTITYYKINFYITFLKKHSIPLKKLN